jgi:hypothetical protein
MSKQMTAEEKQMLQEVKDKKMATKNEKAYNASLTSTVPAPMPAASERKAKGGVTRADGCAKRGKTRGKMV